MIPQEKLDGLLKRHEELGNAIARPDQLPGGEYGKLSRELSELSPIVETVLSLKQARKELDDLKAIIADKDSDAEMKSLAKDEMYQIEKLIPNLERQVQMALLPKDEADARNIILEVRAGTGGDEASLFAMELFRMYQRFSECMAYAIQIIAILLIYL